tara:strand:- start:68 stop:325 length:258 start_codon:yes stop_codon:yes gene_type:complete
MGKLPTTTAHLKINRKSFSDKCLEGEVFAGDFVWEFSWCFQKGVLNLEPSLGRALIHDALLRFLIKADYNLEAGSDYIFTVRAKF